MSTDTKSFTYQPENQGTLEYYEWDNLWFENAPDKVTDRVLVIGDSISCGYRQIITKIASGKFFVDGIGTSKAVDNPKFIPLIDYFVSQISNVQVVLINNGLHGYHLDADKYEASYSLIIEHLKAILPEAKLVMVLTTPVRNQDNLEQYANENLLVKERNSRALKIAQKYEMTVCDLFAVIENKPELYTNDGVHLLQSGYKMLAEQCYRVIEQQF